MSASARWPPGFVGRVEVGARVPAAGELLDRGDVDDPVVQVRLELGHVAGEEAAVGGDGVAAERRLARLGHPLADVGEHLLLGLLQRDAVGELGRAARRRCACRARSRPSGRAPRPAGVMTRSTPSPSTLSSKSVTSAATSMSASFARARPVISQSIQTIRSFSERSVGFCATRTPYGHAADTRRRERPALACPHDLGTDGPTAGVCRGAAERGRLPARAGAGNPTPRPMLRGWVHHRGRRRRLRCSAALVAGRLLGMTLGVVTTLLALVWPPCRSAIVIPTFLWLDRFEAEPTQLPRRRLPVGRPGRRRWSPALLNTSAHRRLLQAATDPEQASWTTAVLFAPWSRRPPRALLVLLVWRLRRREFDGITDGMVYAGICAAGFAFTENIQYLGAGLRRGRRAGADRRLHRPLPAVARSPTRCSPSCSASAWASRRPAAPGCRRVAPAASATSWRCCCTASGTSRPSAAGRGWSPCTSWWRCRCSWPSSASWCGPDAARAA